MRSSAVLKTARRVMTITASAYTNNLNMQPQFSYLLQPNLSTSRTRDAAAVVLVTDVAATKNDDSASACAFDGTWMVGKVGRVQPWQRCSSESLAGNAR
jgi:hypothetical protein